MTEPSSAYRAADRSSPILDMTVGDLLREAAARAPEATALVEGTARPPDRRRWIYAELLEQAERAARALLGRFEPGERVAVWASNIPEWVMLELAAGLAGRAQYLLGAPTMLIGMLAHPAFAATDTSSLRWAITGGQSSRRRWSTAPRRRSVCRCAWSSPRPRLPRSSPRPHPATGRMTGPAPWDGPCPRPR
jgi:acyl-CoA synthetase (AMP-forming)/AMP-acid ligase II